MKRSSWKQERFWQLSNSKGELVTIHVDLTFVPPPYISEDEIAWQKEANCKGVDPDLFFPGRGESKHEAQRVCNKCDVRQECLEFALSYKGANPPGIWGGESEGARRAIRKMRKAQNSARVSHEV